MEILEVGGGGGGGGACPQTPIYVATHSVYTSKKILYENPGHTVHVGRYDGLGSVQFRSSLVAVHCIRMFINL